MAGGVDKSKLAAERKNRNGVQTNPHYIPTRRGPTSNQIACLKDVWRQLHANGIEYGYAKRALIDAKQCSRFIRQAYILAEKHGITLTKGDTNA